MKPFLEILRPFNSLMASLAVILGAFISFGTFFQLPFNSVILASFVVFLVCGSGNVINDYYDYEIDLVNAPNRPLPSGKITKKSALIFSAILFLLGIGISAMINKYALAVAIVASVFLFI